MNCERFELRWNELLDSGQLPQADAQLQEHLLRCPDCRNLTAAQEAVLEAVASLPAPEPPADLNEKILSRLAGSRPARRWMNWKIAASLTTAAAITVACWPALFPRKLDMARPRQMPAEPPSYDVAVPRPAAVDRAPEIGAPPLSALVQEASTRYQELARESREWSDVSRWIPSLGVSFSSNERPGVASVAAEWMGEVTSGLEPVTRSTSATLQSLLQALPDETAVAAGKERAS
jgi:hypothetical protein